MTKRADTIIGIGICIKLFWLSDTPIIVPPITRRSAKTTKARRPKGNFLNSWALPNCRLFERVVITNIPLYLKVSYYLLKYITLQNEPQKRDLHQALPKKQYACYKQ